MRGRQTFDPAPSGIAPLGAPLGKDRVLLQVLGAGGWRASSTSSLARWGERGPLPRPPARPRAGPARRLFLQPPPGHLSRHTLLYQPAVVQASGEAQYTGDVPAPPGTLAAAWVTSAQVLLMQALGLSQPNSGATDSASGPAGLAGRAPGMQGREPVARSPACQSTGGPVQSCVCIRPSLHAGLRPCPGH